MPFDDWQFYAVTAAALLCLWVVARPFVRRRRKPRARAKLTISVKKQRD